MKNLAFLGAFSKLEILTLEIFGSTRDVSALGACKKLRLLRLGQTAARHMEELANCPELEVIYTEEKLGFSPKMGVKTGAVM